MQLNQQVSSVSNPENSFKKGTKFKLCLCQYLSTVQPPPIKNGKIRMVTWPRFPLRALFTCADDSTVTVNISCYPGENVGVVFENPFDPPSPSKEIKWFHVIPRVKGNAQTEWVQTVRFTTYILRGNALNCSMFYNYALLLSLSLSWYCSLHEFNQGKSWLKVDDILIKKQAQSI